MMGGSQPNPLMTPVPHPHRNEPTLLSTIEWHLEHNFFPPMDIRLSALCRDALLAMWEGDPERPININGHLLIAEDVVEDLRLNDLLPQ